MGETHADNCIGQNKNNTLNTRNSLFFSIVKLCLASVSCEAQHHQAVLHVCRHTMFSPDWCFGLLKQKLRFTAYMILSSCGEWSSAGWGPRWGDFGARIQLGRVPQSPFQFSIK